MSRARQLWQSIELHPAKHPGPDFLSRPSCPSRLRKNVCAKLPKSVTHLRVLSCAWLGRSDPEGGLTRRRVWPTSGRHLRLALIRRLRAPFGARREPGERKRKGIYPNAAPLNVSGRACPAGTPRRGPDRWAGLLYPQRQGSLAKPTSPERPVIGGMASPDHWRLLAHGLPTATAACWRIGHYLRCLGVAVETCKRICFNRLVPKALHTLMHLRWMQTMVVRLAAWEPSMLRIMWKIG